MNSLPGVHRPVRAQDQARAAVRLTDSQHPNGGLRRDLQLAEQTREGW
jgi:hypothetical protein